MPANQSGGVGPMQKAQTGANILVFVARVLATPLEVCLRRNFGTRYFGFQALGALVAIGLWASMWPGTDGRPVVWFWWFVVLMFLRARRESIRLSGKGASIHTRYNGWPRLAAVFKRMPEAKIKASVEPVVSGIAGLALLTVSEALGSLLIVSAIALGMVQSTIEAVEQARASELNDALIEQQTLAERFREMQRDRR